jgi:hypothetical protein
MTGAQKRLLEALGFGAAAMTFGVFWLAAGQLDAKLPMWQIYGYLMGMAVSATLALWRLVLFFRS